MSKKNNNDPLKEKGVNGKSKKYSRTLIILFMIFDSLLCVFLILFFLLKCNGDEKDSKESPTTMSIIGKKYKGFYDHLKSVSIDYMETNFSKSNYTSVINSIGFNAHTLSYFCVSTDSGEGALFNVTVSNPSLEDAIKSYDASSVDLSISEIEVTRYNSASFKNGEFNGTSIADTNIKIKCGIYKENDNYFSEIKILDNADNIVSSNKIVANNDTPYTSYLFKYMLEAH